MDISNERIFILLRQIGETDESAMRELYRAFSRKVYAYVLNHVKDPGEAEEIMVDTMHEVWKHPDRFRGESLTLYGQQSQAVSLKRVPRRVIE